MNYVKYDKATGEILSQESGPEEYMKLDDSDDVGTLRGDGDDVLDMVDLETMEIINRTAANIQWNKTSIVADGLDVATASNVPLGATVAIVGGGTSSEIVVDDGVLEVTVDVAGEYAVKITAFPFLEYEATLNGTN